MWPPVLLGRGGGANTNVWGSVGVPIGWVDDGLD